MKIHRFLVDKIDTLIQDRELVDQIKKVLKIKKGERIIIFENDGKDILCEIKDFTDRGIKLIKLEEIENRTKSNREVFLNCSVLKKDNFELVVQKATEIGVRKIIPIICDNTVKTNLNLSRLRKIAKEAVEQSGRNIIPEISEIMSFEEAIKQAPGDILFCNMSGEKIDTTNGKVSIFIGPEGGWSQNELNKGLKEVNVGKGTLRAETAAIIACGILCL